jgi:hypothetical protein
VLGHRLRPWLASGDVDSSADDDELSHQIWSTHRGDHANIGMLPSNGEWVMRPQ